MPNDADKELTRDEQSREELEKENGEPLPRREVMSIVDPGGDGSVYTLPVEPITESPTEES